MCNTGSAETLIDIHHTDFLMNFHVVQVFPFMANKLEDNEAGSLSSSIHITS